jgi:Ca2+-binding RTX toxin-like protein
VVLASQTVPQASVPTTTFGFVSVLFSAPATVVAGVQYAIVLLARQATGCDGLVPGGNGCYGLGLSTENPYAAGQTADSSDLGVKWTADSELDLAFRTYVTPTAISCSAPPPVGAIMGTAGNNTITGTAGRDVIFALGGSDAIDGRGGDDTICAGAGNDAIDAGAGNDTVFGEAGNDAIDGGAGNDQLSGGTGNDALLGGIGNDTLDGGTNSDTATACEKTTNVP